jgi:hypothetical protein
MALPKIATPVFTIKIPSTEREMKFRPFLVKEEKLLLMAQQGENNDILFSLKQIINNCCFDDLNIDDLTTFDLEYVFLKLRSRSVNNIAKLRYRDNEDDEVYDFEVNLDEVEIKFDPENDKKIQINDEVGMILKFPSVKITEKMSSITDQNELLNKILIHTIDVIYDKENVYPAKESTEQELIDFLENLDTKSFKKIEQFFTTMPKLYHELHYKNSLGHDRVIKLSSMQDFFT